MLACAAPRSRPRSARRFDLALVQSLLDEGRITPAEAASHPQRSLLLRAIDGSAVELDTSLHEARAGDRYLLAPTASPAWSAPR